MRWVSSKVSIVIIILLLYYLLLVVPKFRVFLKLYPLCYKLFHRVIGTNDYLNIKTHSLSHKTWNYGTIQVNQTLNMELSQELRVVKTELSGFTPVPFLTIKSIATQKLVTPPKYTLHIFGFTYFMSKRIDTIKHLTIKKLVTIGWAAKFLDKKNPRKNRGLEDIMKRIILFHSDNLKELQKIFS